MHFIWVMAGAGQLQETGMRTLFKGFSFIDDGRDVRVSLEVNSWLV
jgi:hypothetical protein